MLQTKSSYANAVISDDNKVLQDIHLTSKNIAIYQRDLLEPLSKELKQITEHSIECRANGKVEEIMATLKDYFSSPLNQCSFLLDDVSELLGLFEKLTQASSFRLILTTVSTNMCRKFHTDINHLRLLCTYIGPGTLWLPDEIVDHQALRKGKGDQTIIIDEQQIQQVPTGDVVILKGALYAEKNPILHRSPNIEEQGEKRLLLRIDTNEVVNLFA